MQQFGATCRPRKGVVRGARTACGSRNRAMQAPAATRRLRYAPYRISSLAAIGYDFAREVIYKADISRRLSHSSAKKAQRSPNTTTSRIDLGALNLGPWHPAPNPILDPLSQHP